MANRFSDNVSAYAINATTGTLTPVGTTAAVPNTNPRSVAVDPSGKFAYVANYGTGNVSVFTIHPTTGALTNIGTVAAGGGSASVTVDPSGKFVYVANEVSNTTSAYSINAGALTSAGSVPAAEFASPVSVATTGTIQ